MRTGIVKWFNDAKGYGFIQHDDGRDIFVHHTVIEMAGFRTLIQHDLVDYELAEGPKGLLAVRVRPLHQGQQQSRTCQAQDRDAGPMASP